MSSQLRKKNTHPELTIIFFRSVIVLGAVFAWFWTQSLIGAHPLSDQIQDAVLDALAPVNRYLAVHLHLTAIIIVLSSAYMDAIALFLIAWGLFGRTFRPFIGHLFALILRQSMQVIVHLPIPPHQIWFDPGVPSLFATYTISNDLYFSGHTVLAVYGAIQLFYLDTTLGILASCMALFEILVVLSLNCHWTMDVFTGLLVAILSAIVAHVSAPRVDAFIRRTTSSFKR